jgi:hypothetical protein
MFLRRLLWLAVTGFLFPAASIFAQGEALNLPVGGHLVRVGIAWHTARTEYGLDGTSRQLFPDTLLFRNSTFGQTDIMLYGELGLTDWLTGSAETHYLTIVREAKYLPTARDTTVSASGLGDIWLKLRFRIADTSSLWAASFSAGFKAPTGATQQEIPLGTGVPDYSLGAAGRIPWMLGSVTGHWEGSLRYVFRRKAANDVEYFSEFSVLAGRGLTFYGILQGVSSAADFESSSGDPAARRIRQNLVGDQSHTSWEVGGRLAVDDDLKLAIFLANRFAGRNTLASSSFGIALCWHAP